jgi:ABC-type xylose transport system permease subunit
VKTKTFLGITFLAGTIAGTILGLSIGALFGLVFAYARDSIPAFSNRRKH